MMWYGVKCQYTKLMGCEHHVTRDSLMECDSVTCEKSYLCRIVFGRPSSSSSLRLASSSCVSVCGTGSGGIDGSATNGWAGPHAPPGPAPPVLPRSREPDREVVYAVVGFLLCLHRCTKQYIIYNLLLILRMIHLTTSIMVCTPHKILFR